MNAIPKKLTMSVLLAAVAVLTPTSVFALQDTPEEKSKEIIVTGQQPDRKSVV